MAVLTATAVEAMVVGSEDTVRVRGSTVGADMGVGTSAVLAAASAAGMDVNSAEAVADCVLIPARRVGGYGPRPAV